MEYKDYYKVLGVERDADEKEVKRAYRRLARKYHPDVNQGDASAEARFKDINEAYEVLGDPEKRAKYDRFGHEWQRYQHAGAPPGGFDWSAWTQPSGGPGVQYRRVNPEDLEGLFGSGGFSDFFEALFGGGRGRARPVTPRRGQDLRHPVQVSLVEAAQGTTRTLLKDGRRLEVTIPPGVRTGSKVRVRGEGGPAGSGAAAGDLYLEIEVLPDPRFERDGNDLHVRQPIPLTTAVLGGEVTVPTLAGDVHLAIPPETQNGRRFRLAGKGMPELRRPTTRGDLYVTVEVRLPTGLSSEERGLFERLRALRG